MMAQLPNPDEMIPAGFTADGSRKYRITGFYAELFDNLQVSDAALNNVTDNAQTYSVVHISIPP